MNKKAFEVILPSSICNRDCPYCTAKITCWSQCELDLKMMDKRLSELDEHHYKFKYMILSGNGEPSMYSLNTFKLIMDLYNKYKSMLGQLRTQSSGNIFECPDKLNVIPKDALIELTRVYLDYYKDKEILKYETDYLGSMKKSNFDIRMNIVILKNTKVKDIIDEIDEYILLYPVIKVFSLKPLNLNTLTDDLNNPYSQWILNNALPKRDYGKLLPELVNKLGEPSVEFDGRYTWKYRDKEISLYRPSGEYGDSHIVFYGNELVDFKLNKLKIY